MQQKHKGRHGLFGDRTHDGHVVKSYELTTVLRDRQIKNLPQQNFNNYDQKIVNHKGFISLFFISIMKTFFFFLAKKLIFLIVKNKPEK